MELQRAIRWNYYHIKIKTSKKIRKKLIKKGVCLLAGEPRSGKTLSFIDAAHKMYNRILIITQKKLCLIL